MAGLGAIAPYDWAGFLERRLDEVAPTVPTEWLRRSGYRLIFTDAPTKEFAAHHERADRLDLRYGPGLVLRASTGAVTDVIWDSAAFEAGLVPGAAILTVNGVTYDPEALLAAIRRNGGGGTPIELTIMHRDRERAVTLDYSGGLRFPRLERVPEVPDRLGKLLEPRRSR